MGIAEQLTEIKTEEALKKGLRQGFRKGRAQEKENLILGLLTSTRFSAQKIAGLVDVSVSVVHRLKMKLKDN